MSRIDFDSLIAKGSIDANDVQNLRRTIYGDDFRIDAHEAAELFRLNDACDGSCAEWPDLFVEAITDFLVNQVTPAGYVSQSHADWLIDSISASGVVRSETELMLLIKVLEKANEVPESLRVFAMAQVRTAVLKGDGPIRAGSDLKPGQIGRTEVDILRRALYATAGHGSAAVSRAEAEMLFDINDAVTDAGNDPSWPDLFMKAVANYLMAARGFTPPSRETALRRETWLDDKETDIGGFFGKILAGGLRGVLASYNDDAEAGLRARNAEIATSEVITSGEADWLSDRIGKDGAFDDAERALLLFIKTESPDIHPGLKPLLEKVA